MDDYCVKFKELFKSNYGNSVYNNLWYGDVKNKICISFTPRGGCSISFQQYLDLVGLLNDGLNYDPFIHKYRCDVLDPNLITYNINDLVNEKYTFIKFIMNPYIRAVSIYRFQSSHNLSFREYLNEIEYFDYGETYHLQPQYVDGEENIITKYIKIDKNETFQISLFDGNLYTLDVNKYSSFHHDIKNQNNTTFCGDLPRNIVNENLPKNYKYFYDDELKEMVETFYKNDIQHYNYSFNDMDE